MSLNLREACLLNSRSVTTLLFHAIKDTIPRADFDGVAVHQDTRSFGYKVALIKGDKTLGYLQVDELIEVIDDVNLAKIMLLCG